jgi:SAM-dependent methyltransferase
LTQDGELSTGRDFRVYAAGMDASIAVKITDLCPHVLPGTIVDKGCGTGTLLVHLSRLFPQSQIIGMDLSRELLRIAESQYYPNHNVSIVKGNIIHERFAPGTVSTVLFSSVIHEVYSYNGYDHDQVRRALSNTRRELRPGGRVIVRDGLKPAGGRVWMRCDDETERRFRKFALEFKGKSATPGVRFRECELDGRNWFVLGLHEANEFLSKKDYLENWAIEVQEEFGVFTLAEWVRELEALGYQVLEARSYLNPWILENRYRDRVWLHADTGRGPGEEIAFPDTTAVLVASSRG